MADERDLAWRSRTVGRRIKGHVRSIFDTSGPGFRNLAITNAASTAADTLVAIGLAGTLFFTVPSAEARGNVALYLLMTVAPFAVIGPVLGRVLQRTIVAARAGLVLAAVGRAALAASLVGRLDSWWLFPAAFGLLVLSRVHGITRNTLLPVALEGRHALVAANGRLAWIGVAAGGVAGAIGAGASVLLGVDAPLIMAIVAGLLAAHIGRRLPEPEPLAKMSRAPKDRAPPVARRLVLPHRVRLAMIATATVRLLNGFLLLLLAFAFREVDARLLDFGAVLAAAGLGFGVAAVTAPKMERRLREEPMVVAALAVEAAAAFIAGQWFGLAAASVLAWAAGFAWGTAKLAFDGLLQASVASDRRGLAFTRSETLFALAWVAGAVVPTALPLPPGLGLPLAGIVALGAQIVYVAALLLPNGPKDAGHP